jgi:inorganic phosphate transporter, PiT family
MTIGTIVLVAVLVGGLYMAWGIGANDVANAMGTSVGSGALTLVAAILLAGVLEFGGAVLIGSTVTQTVSRGIIDTQLFAPDGPLGADGPVMLALGMLSALAAAAVWLHLATHFGLPVSTTHSIVGAVVGVGLVSFGFSGVAWAKMGQIAASWVVSPLLGGLLAYATFRAIRLAILSADDPIGATARYAPYIVGGVVAVMVLSFIYKVLSNRIETPSVLTSLIVAGAAGLVAGILASAVTRYFTPGLGVDPYSYVERVFGLLQIGTACFVAFGHGANDVANAIGPVAAVVTLYQDGFATVATKAAVPFWVLVLGGGGIVLGLATMGYKVIATVGRSITEITPTRGFCAEFGAATTVLLASSLGLPISTTHTLVGAVVGVGFARGIGALNLLVIRNIATSWLATVPLSAGFAALLYVVARFFVV